MPLFSRSSFRSTKKPPKRKSSSLTNVSALSESTYSLQDLQLESGPVNLKLGGQELVFEKGEWLIDGPKGTTNSREYVKLQRQNKQLLEENNLLKYKIELLLDMLAASNADCVVLHRELDALKDSRRKK
ncbi:protein chibby homolog 1-like [Dysidea avara]|uniref:protein chibby homolog 1-like n=1 Tax=Dysidea avara TaxID=196820 RepID=UPI0033259DF5